MGLPIIWLSHLRDPKEREQFGNLVRHNTSILGRLREIIDQMALNVSKFETSAENFQTPEFAYRQAFLLGQRKVLADLRKLVDFGKDDHD